MQPRFERGDRSQVLVDRGLGDVGHLNEVAQDVEESVDGSLRRNV
jgi:hypothetical protein